MIEKLIEIHLSLTKEIEPLIYKRYLYSNVHWNSRLIGIVGARGVGKTTLMLQYYLDHFKSPEDCLYFSADNIHVANKGLFPLAEEFFRYAGTTILIDEIHKYPNWQVELKNIYDSFPTKKIIFSGSSTISILQGRGDLSRRVVFYHLKGLSFREFLCLQTQRAFEPIAFNQLLQNHAKIAKEINSNIPVLRHFRDYLNFGYYPFFKEGVEVFYGKLSNAIEKIFYEDIPLLFNVKPTTVHHLKKLFYLVATSQPFVPNISRISAQLGISKEYIYTYIEELEKAGLLILLHPKEKGFKLLRKPQKIYLENANLFALIVEEKGFGVEKGNIRETFFLNQVSSTTRLYATDRADFIDGQGRLFEIGGKSKSTGEVHLANSQQDSFIVCDEMNVGFKNKIPLWLFGFLY